MNTPPHPHILAIGLCLAICPGCGNQDAEGPTAGQSAKVRTTQPIAETARHDAELPPQEIVRIAGLIRAANGVVMRNADGRITGVDVARDRTPVDDVTAKEILQLRRLEVLRLAVNAVTPELLAQLTSQSQLTELLLRDAPATDKQLVQLVAGLPRLKRLTLRRVIGVTDAGIEAVATLPELEVLALIEMPLTGAQLTSLKKIERLRSLDLRLSEGLIADDYRPLLEMRQLTEVKLGGQTIDDAVLEVVAGLPTLESLAIEDSPVSAAPMLRLAENRELAGRMHAFAFTRCYGLTDDVLSRIIVLPRLETLSIRECPISGRFLIGLEKVPTAELPRLQTLVITRAFLPDEAIGILPRLAGSLTRLDLSGVMLSRVMMQSIGELHELQALNLASCSLENEAIQPLAALKKLKTLDLSGNFGLTDEAVQILDALPELEEINTHDTSITSRDDV